MKLMDKIKNLFLDEEDDIDEEEFPNYEEKEKSKKELKKELKKEEYKEEKDTLPKVMRDTIKKEEKKEEPEEEKISLKITPDEFINQEKNIKEPVEPVKKFNFPIDFDNDLPSRNKPKLEENFDFTPKEHNSNINVLKMEKQVQPKVAELYSKKEEEKIKPRFKASPVISPVYGILDKNYTKEEVKEKSEESVEIKRPSKKVDFETVRKKAFGNLTDEIKDNLICENCELYKEVQKINSLKEDDLLYEMTVEDKKSVTIEKAYDDYEEFGVAYEPTSERKKQKDKTTTDNDSNFQELTTKIEPSEEPIIENSDEKHEDYDESNENEDKDKESLIKDIEKEMKTEEKIPSREEKKKETKVDDDFFELIDSMYKERVDE